MPTLFDHPSFTIPVSSGTHATTVRDSHTPQDVMPRQVAEQLKRKVQAAHSTSIGRGDFVDEVSWPI